MLGVPQDSRPPVPSTGKRMVQSGTVLLGPLGKIDFQRPQHDAIRAALSRCVWGPGFNLPKSERHALCARPEEQIAKVMEMIRVNKCRCNPTTVAVQRASHRDLSPISVCN